MPVFVKKNPDLVENAYMIAAVALLDAVLGVYGDTIDPSTLQFNGVCIGLDQEKGQNSYAVLMNNDDASVMIVTYDTAAKTYTVENSELSLETIMDVWVFEECKEVMGVSTGMFNMYFNDVVTNLNRYVK